MPKEYNYPVIYGAITKLRRGYYEMSFQLLEENPAGTPYGHISELHTRTGSPNTSSASILALDA